MRNYELMYILDPTLDEDASKTLVGKIEDLIAKQGAELESTEPWGKRRLAYQIKGHWEGNYVLSYLKAQPGAINEVQRRLRVTDGVLRYLAVRVDEDKAKAERRKERREKKEKARRARRVASEGETRESSGEAENLNKIETSTSSPGESPPASGEEESSKGS